MTPKDHGCTSVQIGRYLDAMPNDTRVPAWLPETVKASLVAEHLRGVSPEWLREANGLLLYGTIGHSPYLREDGSVWFHSPVDRLRNPDAWEWQQATPLQRLGAINLGTERDARLKGLLPTRLPTTPDCARCKGTGLVVVKVQCPDCAGLGWVPDLQ